VCVERSLGLSRLNPCVCAPCVCACVFARARVGVCVRVCVRVVRVCKCCAYV